MSSYPGISQYKSGFGRVSFFQMEPGGTVPASDWPGAGHPEGRLGRLGATVVSSQGAEARLSHRFGGSDGRAAAAEGPGHYWHAGAGSACAPGPPSSESLVPRARHLKSWNHPYS